MPVNLAVRRLRQEVPEFKDSLGSDEDPGQLKLLKKTLSETRKRGRDGERWKRVEER